MNFANLGCLKALNPNFIIPLFTTPSCLIMRNCIASHADSEDEDEHED